MKTILNIPQKAGSWRPYFCRRILGLPYFALEVDYPTLPVSNECIALRTRERYTIILHSSCTT
jgi:hypothetical protein